METNKRIYTIQELADKYEVNKRTIYQWLLPIRKELLEMNGTKRSRLRILLPKQVKLITDFLGE